MADLLFIFIIVYVLHVKHWGYNVPSISTKDYIMVIKNYCMLNFVIDRECTEYVHGYKHMCNRSAYIWSAKGLRILSCVHPIMCISLCLCECMYMCVFSLTHRADTHSASFPVEASPWCPLTQYLWGWLAEELNTPS